MRDHHRHGVLAGMTTMLMRALDAAFGHPRGLAGRLGGAIMARGNAEQERWAVQHAELGPGAHVLVVGHGPGIGVALAADAVHPGGNVIAVDPSATMRDMATARCAEHISAGRVELRDGSAEETGCADSGMDAAISVNNVMLWNRPAGFAELHRVLRPGGRLVITVHRHVLGVAPDQLHAEATAAGFTNLTLSLRERRLNSPAVELLAQRPNS
jgi:arsenite methyltransferase